MSPHDGTGTGNAAGSSDGRPAWEWHTGADDGHDDDPLGHRRPPPRIGASADVLVAALYEAGPEAAEHLLNAARELLLAAKAVVDAGDRVVEQCRQAGPPAPDAPDAPDRSSSRVRHIDVS